MIKERLNTNDFKKNIKWEEHEKENAIRFLIEQHLNLTYEELEEQVSVLFFREYGLESVLKSGYKGMKNAYDIVRYLYPDYDFVFISEKKSRKRIRELRPMKCEGCGVTNKEKRIYSSDTLGADLCKSCYNKIWGAKDRIENTKYLIGDDRYYCKICGMKFSDVIPHVNKMHGMNKEEYIQKYNIPYEGHGPITFEEFNKLTNNKFKIHREDNHQTSMELDVKKEKIVEEKIPRLKLKDLIEKFKLESFQNLIKTRDTDFLMRFLVMIQADIDKGKSIEENQVKISIIDYELKKKFKKESK